jgi:carboxymethylenebutenolidase
MTERLPETQNWIATGHISRRAAIAGSAALTGYALAAGPVGAQAITTDTKGLDAGWTTVPAADGVALRAYRARPADVKTAPLLLVSPEIFGLHAWVQDICRRFAKAGYDAIAVDPFQRQGDPTKITEIPALVRDIVSKASDAQVMSDLDATVAFASRSGGDAKRLAITGFCWGGRVTWLYAAHNPAVRAGVAWYGRVTGKPTELQPMVPIELVERINAPVVGLYGTRDRGIPVTDVEAMNAALKAAGKPSELRLFEADHGFLADYRPSYAPEAAKEAWAQALAWLQRHTA